jgi:hypothetical protein
VIDPASPRRIHPVGRFGTDVAALIATRQLIHKGERTSLISVAIYRYSCLLCTSSHHD